MMFSTIAQEHIQNPKYMGQLETATHIGQEGTPGDGPYCILYLEIQEDVIQRAAYETNGCPTSIASAGLLCQLITGKTLEKTNMITAEDLTKLVGPIPEGKGDCPMRTIQALRKIQKEL